jgi:HAD superfamily hydrolase (TIGR01509 family)
VKGAIFDLDGVLVDSHPVHLRAWKRLLNSVGKSVKDHDMSFVLEGRKREEILQHFLGELTHEQLDQYGRQKEFFFQEESKNIETIPGVHEFLEKLAATSIPLAVASCGGRSRVNNLLEYLDLRRYFQVVVTGDDVKEGKPDAAIFRLAAQRYGVAPKDSVCLEDSISGVMAAKAAGMKCLGIAESSRGASLREMGADKVVPNFVDLTVADLQTLFE